MTIYNIYIIVTSEVLVVVKLTSNSRNVNQKHCHFTAYLHPPKSHICNIPECSILPYGIKFTKKDSASFQQAVKAVSSEVWYSFF